MSNSNAKFTNGISHVGLSVSNLEATLQFFKALGFNKVGGVDSYPSVFVSDGTSLLTLWQTDPNATPFDRRSNVGLHHLAVRVQSKEALDDAFHAVSQLERVRVEFKPQALEGMPLTHAMVYEPSGVRIELTYHEE